MATVTLFLPVWNSWVSGILGSSVNFSVCSFFGGAALNNFIGSQIKCTYIGLSFFPTQSIDFLGSLRLAHITCFKLQCWVAEQLSDTEWSRRSGHNMNKEQGWVTPTDYFQCLEMTDYNKVAQASKRSSVFALG